MNYAEAIAEATRGRKIRRKVWSKDRYCSFGDSVYLHMRDGDIDEGGYVYYDDAVADDWEIVTEPISFATAIKAVADGKKVRRKFWSFVLRTVGMNHILSYSHPDGRVYAANFSKSDIQATDWIILD